MYFTIEISVEESDNIFSCLNSHYTDEVIRYIQEYYQDNEECIFVLKDGKITLNSQHILRLWIQYPDINNAMADNGYAHYFSENYSINDCLDILKKEGLIVYSLMNQEILVYDWDKR